MPDTLPSPRRAAAHLLGQVLGEGRLLSDALGDRDHGRMPAEARAEAQRLATETLRALPRLDALIAPHLRKAPPLRARNVLRIATWELAHGGAAHGVVNGAVDTLAASKRTAGFKGLANAVLRKIADDAPARWETLPIPALPDWLRGPLVEAWGADAVAAMERAHFAGAPLDLTARDDPAALAEATGGTLLPTGSVRLARRAQVSALPGYDDGRFWVQDAAAALPARLLGDVTGRRVLDMCAAPGGKTLQLAAAGAEVTALDVSEARLGRVRENLARTGLSAAIVAGDALAHAGGPYDAVLLDAPCSATGTIRRHPDLPHARAGEGIADLIELQARMLDRALDLVAPGGRVVYCTCSLLPDEGECQVEEAIERHDGLTVLPAEAPGLDPDWRTPEGGLRLRPDAWADRGGLDGFYMAVLARAG
ncbi:Ribosomal RNA small subunit methyltransferase B [Roseivivax jejudonensis]|uniref:Ribosomal RNA small subunit methyltransferase B n=1 Tax=Roseivivax jejudonensis TaxID=1529041 RepID=A0A1X7A162_9RHOB|nr:transcription antitermination factor NusB [Roseivivax jejudonensis]SLN67103.1 Ribosomal RNA small subunit methyltransferase B [Roseivivax jejudonensis]